MDVYNNNVTFQLHLVGLNGKQMRVCDCDVFIIRVFTSDPKHYISFTARDILMTEFADEITIPYFQMQNLESGVVQYTYHWLPKAHDCVYEEDPVEEMGAYHPERFHGHKREELNNSRPVVTPVFWRNLKFHHGHPDKPLNSVSLMDIERLHRLIENERVAREKDIQGIQAEIGEGYLDKLNEEIERSKTADEQFAQALEKLGADLDDFTGASGDINDKVQGDIIANTQGLKEEVERAVKAEAQLEGAISAEIARAKAAEEVNATAIQMEKERATANEGNLGYRIDAVNEKFEAFKTIESNSLQTEVERAKSVESQINTRVDGVVKDLADEISRAAQKDIEHTNLVSTESNRAQAVENKIATDLETETNRAKDAEKHLLDEVHSVQETVANLATATNVYTKAEVDTKVNEVKNDVSTVQNWINNHTDNTAELNAKVSGLVADMDKAKADILAEVAKCDAENGKLATDIQTLSDSTYTKAEIDSKVSGIDSSIVGINNWIENHKDNTEGLAEKVNKNIADIQSLTTDLANETTARINGDLTLTTKVEVAEGKVDAEIVRAKDSEKLISDNLDDFKSQANAKDAELDTAIAGVSADLTLEIARAKAAEKVNSDAIEIINGDVSTAGSIKKSLADSKDYTDAEIAKLSLAKDAEIADTLKFYATKSEVDQKISDVIGTAPEALDTLGKISNALSQDSDAITAINGVLAGKADADNVYTKAEVDTTISGVNNSISTLETKVDNADATINGRIDDLATKVDVNKSGLVNDVSVLSAGLADEIARAKAAEKANADNLTAEVTNLNDKYNELNAKVIADIADSTAKDTEIDANIAAIQTLLANVDAKIDAEVVRATNKDNELVAADTSIAAKVQANSDNLSSEIARAKQVETELNDKINGIDLAGANTAISAEVDRATAAENAIQSNLDAEVVRAKAAEKATSDALADEVTRAKAAEKALDDKISGLDLDGANSAISGVNDKIDSEITRATAQETALGNSIQTVSDNLADEVTRAKAAEQANADAIAAIDLTPIRNDVSTLDNKVDIEVTRAKAAEQANADAIATLQTSVSGANDSVTNLSAALTQLQADSQAKDSEIETGLNTEKTRAENAEAALDAKIAVINGDSSTVGSIAHAIHDAEHYTDDEIAKIQSALDIHKAEADAKYLTEHQSLADYYNKSQINDIFDGYATKGYVSNIAEECARLDQAIQLVSSDTYTKAEVDEAIANVDVTEQLKDYISKADAVEVIENAVAESENIAAIQSNLAAEVTRAKAAEQEIMDSISNVSDTLEAAIADLNNLFDIPEAGEGETIQIATISDIETALEDYYTKEEITSVLATIDFDDKYQVKGDYLTEHQSLEDYYTKEESDDRYQAKGDYLTEHQSLDDYYTKSEVNGMIPDISGKADADDVYTKDEADDKYQVKGDYLTEHQSLEEVNAAIAGKADASAVYTKAEVNEMIPDVSDKANADDVYTKEEADAIFCKAVRKTADEYEAMVEAGTIDENTLYIIVA